MWNILMQNYMSRGQIWITSVQTFIKLFSKIWLPSCCVGFVWTLLCDSVKVNPMVMAMKKSDLSFLMAVTLLEVVKITLLSAVILVIVYASNRRHRQFVQMLNDYSRIFLPVALSTITYFGVCYLGLLCLMIPGIFFMISLSLFLPIVVIERCNSIEALHRSMFLVKGNWFDTLSVMLFPALILMGMMLSGIQAIYGSYQMPQGLIGNIVMTWITFSAFVPLMMIIMMTWYRQLKYRKDCQQIMPLS